MFHLNRIKNYLILLLLFISIGCFSNVKALVNPTNEFYVNDYANILSEETEKYISKVLTRLTVVGALFLVVLAALPIACRLIPNMPANVSIGGTGLLIVVGVALETYKQIENIVVSRNYSRSYK